MTRPILETVELSKYFERGSFLEGIFPWEESDKIRAVDGVSLNIEPNESIGVVGESGCGKTTLLRTIIGLYKPTHGEVRYDGRITSNFSRKEWKSYRRNVQMIFQDPFNALDPKMSIEESLRIPLEIHNISDRKSRVEDVLRSVELQPVDEYLGRYPSQLSGGELQRISIARALILEPKILLADEPMSMLDVSTQAAILNLLDNLKEEKDLSIIYISHDLSTVSYLCESVNVMYLGRIVEKAATLDLLDEPKHPYTQALVRAIPYPDPYANRERTSLEDGPMDVSDAPEGCRFRDRCPERMDICEIRPKMVEIDNSSNRYASCHLYYNHRGDCQ